MCHMTIWRCWVPYPFRFFIYAAECITNSKNPSSIASERVLCILGRFAVFWKYAGSIRYIRKPFGVFGNHSETILKTFGTQTENIRWYIEEIWGKHIQREIRTVSKIPPLPYSENKRNGIRPSVNGPRITVIQYKNWGSEKIIWTDLFNISFRYIGIFFVFFNWP
jgi:hypothetical protein